MLIEVGCVLSTIAAIGISEVNDRYFKWKSEWNNLMLDNKLDSYKAIERKKEVYGYKYIINIKGCSYDKLEKIKDIIGSYYNCNVEMEQSDTNRSVAVVHLITNQQNDSNTKFKPHRTKPYEVFVALDNKYNPIVVDMNKLPHLLCSGCTGSGKTEELRGIVTNLIANYSNRDIELYFSDLSDMVDFDIFAQCKQVKSYARDINQALILFNHIMHIYKKRLSIFGSNNCKNIKEYNSNFKDKRMSYIYVVADEFADYMPSKETDSDYKIKNECYEIIKHLLRKARKVGIFILVGIQRPDFTVLDTNLRSSLCTQLGFAQNNPNSSKIVCNDDSLANIEPRKGLAMYGNRRDWFRSIYLDDKIINECISGSIDKDHKDILFNKSDNKVVAKSDNKTKTTKKKSKAKIS